MTLHTFLLYALTWLVVAVTPGPAVMCAMAQSSRYGFRGSWAGIGGIQVGNVVFFLGIGAGVGALLATAGVVFDVLRVVGALYLMFLGARAFLSSLGAPKTTSTARPGPTPPTGSLFLQGLLIQFTNPKALLFMSALLPQFIHPAAAVAPQLALLAAATLVIDLVVLSTYAYLAQMGGGFAARPRWGVWLERIFGAALMGFGVRLLFSRQSA